VSAPLGPAVPSGPLYLDGVREDIVAPATGARTALGTDPFETVVTIDPFLERLDSLHGGGVVPRRSRRERPEPHEPPIEAPPPVTRLREATAPPKRARRAWATTPRLDEVELDAADGMLERLIGEGERRRLAAVGHLVDGDAPYDRYGLSPGTLRAAFPFFHALYRFYFRVKSHGHEHLPAEGPAILAANHGGLLPFDGAMGILDVLLHTDPPRLARAIVDRWAGRLPWVNVFYARVGQVVGTRENFSDLLEDGQLVLVFPEGVEGIRKPVTQRYRLQRFHVGFVEQSLRSGAPIVPMAFLGTDDQAPILFDVKPLARRLGLPAFPITPTFPWLGPLGLLPYPVSYRIVYGEPLTFHERFGPEGADDARLVRYLANQVRRTVQLLVDRHR
jgi:1-acyl-sn-glycerol-3-phosphate acyltransferase